MGQASKKKYTVGFDLGGTKMLAKVFDENFQPIAQGRKKTKGHAGAERGMERVVELIETVLSEARISTGDLAAIGVGCPGPLDLDRGLVLEMPNLGWKHTPVKQMLEEAFHCPAVIVNDVDGGVYGEYRFGAAQAARCVVGCFPGTGIGGGCVYEGHILRGRTGSCLEIGHIPVVSGGPLCGCGNRGCLEAVASRLALSAAAATAAYRGQAPQLMAATGTDLTKIRSSALATAVSAGDTAVEQIIRDAVRHIGRALAGVVNLLAPDVIVLGGGLVEAMPKLFCTEMGDAIREHVMPSFRPSLEVVAAKLGDDATATGAAAWARTVAG